MSTIGMALSLAELLQDCQALRQQPLDEATLNDRAPLAA